MRRVNREEESELIARGCSAQSWDNVYVSDDFTTSQLSHVRFAGRVEIESGVQIADSYISNYHIGKNTTIESVTRMECRTESSFGVGEEVSPVNENGGRSILLYDTMTAQIAYIWVMHRHRTAMVEQFRAMARDRAAQVRSTMGSVGENCRIIGAKFIREVAIKESVTIDGASLLECGTILPNSFIGVDVKMHSFIVAESARVDTGATIERAFIGESVIAASGFTALDSLLFANSHFENGEAASIFAGPYTVSHHKSSLLIAGMFSFFNAGSASNQSNHLFKGGAVHQAIHPRGCKFASGAYIMAPAREGAFTMVKGYHARHHDTSAFPYSYLINRGERSSIIPGISLTSYGTRRDIDKWVARDRRKVFRDVINFEEFNPYLTYSMVNAVNTLHTLRDRDSEADEYMWERVVISRAHLRRGIDLYNKAIVASIGDMLSRGELINETNISGSWIDLSGGYYPLAFVDALEDSIESGEVDSFEAVDTTFKAFSAQYDSYAHTWAFELLGQLIGHTPTEEDVAAAKESAKVKMAELATQVERDKESDCDRTKAIGYGHDSQEEQVVMADYRAVRSL